MISQIGIEVRDISYDPSKGFALVDGDFSLTDSYTYQGDSRLERVNECDLDHLNRILKSTIGCFREYPVLGVDLKKELLGPVSISSRDKLRSKIKNNLELGGNFSVDSISISSSMEISVQLQRVKA